MTTKLAELLRQAATKWPEKFEVKDGWECTRFIIRGVDEFAMHYTSEPHVFTLDPMDAVCAAVGMEFELMRTHSCAWDWYVYEIGMPGICFNGSESLESKRLASIAATIAILEYKLGKEGE